MAGILTRTLTGAAVSILAGGAAAVGVTTVASAHTPEVSATCTELRVHLTNYPANSTVGVVLDGQDEGTDTFGTSGYDATFPLDGSVAHTWSVHLTSGDGDHAFDRTIDGESSGACLATTPPATTPPVSTPPSTTPPVTTPPATTPPVTTPPATTPPVTTPPATTPPVTTPPATTPPATTPPATTPANPGNTTVPLPTPSGTPGTGTNTPAATTVPVPVPSASGSATPAVGTGTTGGNGGSGSTGTGTGTGTASGDQLAYTGSTVGMGVGVGALTTVLVGGALTAIAAVRRRRQSRI